MVVISRYISEFCIASGAHCVKVNVRYLISWWILVSFAANFGIGKLESVQGYCTCGVVQAGLRPNWAWAWCCSQKGTYFILGIQDRTSPITCDATTLYWTRLHKDIMVPFEIDIKLSTINSKGLNVLIARKESRRPCCRREPPRDVGHLYRKLALINW